MKSKLTLIPVLITAICLGSCADTNEVKQQVIGSWRIKRANIHTIYSFRANGSWAEQIRVEGRFSRIVETKKEIEGVWDVEVAGEEVYKLVMIPNEDSEGKWVKEQPLSREIVSIDATTFSLKNEDGSMLNWARVRGTQIEDDTAGLGVTNVRPGPLVVNLKQDRSYGKFRFICIDLEFSVQDIETNDYVVVDQNPETGAVTAHLHPKIREVAIYYFSSLTYKDIKSLNKVKTSVDKLTTILNPYFAGNLQKITVKKVVVTAKKQSVEEFERFYAVLAAAEDAAEGGSSVDEETN